jgi:nucleoid-associated protein YgaU
MSNYTFHSNGPVPGYQFVVRRGDRPDSIVEEAYAIEEENLDTQKAWETIYNANREIIGDDPQRIAPGQILFIPVAVGKPGKDKIPHPLPTSEPVPGSYYVVKKGETLQAISQQAYGTYEQWEAIYTANKDIIGFHPIYVAPGQVLFIPRQDSQPDNNSAPSETDKTSAGPFRQFISYLAHLGRNSSKTRLRA